MAWSATRLPISLALALLTTAQAQGQTQPPSGAGEIGAIQRLERDQLERLRQEQRLKQRPVEPGIELPAMPAPGAASQLQNIDVRRIEVDVSDILSAAELREAVAPFENRRLSLSQLYEVVGVINKLYDARQMPTARAVLPPQDVVGGIVRIRLVEARVGEVRVGVENQVSDAFVRERLGLREGQLLSVPELEADLVRFNRLHQAQLSASVKPGKDTGTTDVELLVREPARRRVQTYVDNGGRKTVGETRLGVVGHWYSLRLSDDSLQLSGVAAEGSASVAAAYSTALTADGWRMDASINADRIKIIGGPFVPLDIGGSSQSVSLGVSKPLAVSAERLLLGYGRMAVKSSKSTFGGVTQLSSTVNVLTAGVTGDYQLDGAVWTVDANLNAGTQSNSTDRSFVYLRANTAWLQPIGQQTQWLLRAGMQAGFSPLLPSSEQFQVGGSASVRGYAEGLLTGRSGYLMSAELRHRLHTPDVDSLLPFLTGLTFIDHGGAFPFRPTPLPDVSSRDFLTGAGVGAVADWTPGVQGRLTIGWPLRNRQLDANQSTPKVHASINIGWP